MQANKASIATMVVGIAGTVGLYMTGFFHTHPELVFVVQMLGQFLQSLTRPALESQPQEKKEELSNGEK